MQVRTNRKTETRRRNGVLRRPRRDQRAESATTTEPAVATPEPAVAPHGREDLSDERRLRESGGPDDRAMYTCTCGYVFQADVSTSVSCPHCGAGQAW
jgi:rubrerythrin